MRGTRCRRGASERFERKVVAMTSTENDHHSSGLASGGIASASADCGAGAGSILCSWWGSVVLDRWWW